MTRMLPDGAQSVPAASPGPRYEVRRPRFSAEEIRAVREGIGGVKGMIPARCYHDEEIYRFEVEHILKKNWLCVGRYDWAEKPGDYISFRMLGEPVLVIRDRRGQLHAHINACRHRWARLVPEGTGNTKLIVCPYHSWTYDLDGNLRGITVQDMPEIDKKDCKLHEIRLEVWAGFIFINFDPTAKPLAPQLQGVEQIVGRYDMGSFRTVGRTDYETSWNYKFSFETGYEAYHHEGVHRLTIPNTAKYHRPLAFGEIWGVYVGDYPANLNTGTEVDLSNAAGHVFGPPPWMPQEEHAQPVPAVFIGIYPNLIMYVTEYQASFITTEHLSLRANKATTAIAVPEWALQRPDAQPIVDELVHYMKMVQNEDSAGCRMLQEGVESTYNNRSIIHPLEAQLPHYYNWLMDQYQNA